MKKFSIFGLLLSFVAIAATAQERTLPNWRPYDQRGVNVFETSPEDTIEYNGLQVRVGGNFAQQFQALDHSNESVPVLDADGNNINQLPEIGTGFNLATANLNLDVLLADGVRLNLITYLSSRHHSETWVKGGYIQFDKLPFFKSELIDNIMEKVTIRVGHMEINYGDAHFRRTDNGNAIYNPFVGNYIMDAFTTEIGGEVLYQNNGWLALAAMTGGEIKGGVTQPDDRAPSFYGKLGYDKNVSDNLRVRITGSVYTTSSSASNTLYGGDRAGSRYYNVFDNNFATPRFNPGFKDKITSYVVNPFIKFRGLEIFGNFEQAEGRAANEDTERTWNQFGIDGVYRFGATENFYLAARYNTVSGELTGGTDAQIDRIQVGGGWFLTKNILTKLEYVNQQYKDFAPESIFHGGEFNGLMIEAVIGF